MNEFNTAKNCYNSIEIPQELGDIVKNTIASGSKKKIPPKIHIMRLAPVVVCAAICLAIGINYFSDFGKSDVIIESGASDAALQDTGEQKAARNVPSAGGESVQEDFSHAHKIATDSAETEAANLQNDLLYNYAVKKRISQSLNECIKLENSDEAYGEIEELYSDSEIISYAVNTYPSSTSNFYNIKQSDGSDISIEDIVGDDLGFDDDCEFYFKARDKLVVISDGEEIEVILD